MAIDTEAKRRSAIQHGLPFAVAYIEPDGTIDADDRQHAAGVYAGGAFSPAPPPPPVVPTNQGVLVSVPGAREIVEEHFRSMGSRVMVRITAEVRIWAPGGQPEEPQPVEFATPRGIRLRHKAQVMVRSTSTHTVQVLASKHTLAVQELHQKVAVRYEDGRAKIDRRDLEDISALIKAGVL